LKIDSGSTDVLAVTETIESRQFWVAQEFLKSLEPQLSAADVLIVPMREFRPGVDFVFHQDTPALFEYLKAGLAGQAVVEICAADDEYLEIALHSNIFRLSQIVVSYAIAPVVFGLLTNYIYDELKAKPKDTVELSMTIEDDQCKAFKYSFSGQAKDLDLLADKVAQMARDCKQKTPGAKALVKKKGQVSRSPNGKRPK
jgi:hypothetical protein